MEAAGSEARIGCGKALNENSCKSVKCELFNDNFQNYKNYNIPKAQLVIADLPYRLEEKAYASNPVWYNDGDNSNGESKHAHSSFFPSDDYFNIVEYFAFCNRLLRKDKEGSGKEERIGKSQKRKSQSGAMICFCSFQQYQFLVDTAAKYGFPNSQPIFFIKDYSAQVLKANMKIVGATEMAVVFWRDRLPKFNNDGKMVFDWFKWERDPKGIPKVHPTQKPQSILRRLIEIFTDEGDIVIDPVAGSGSTLLAAKSMGRNSYGFEISKEFYAKAMNEVLGMGNKVNDAVAKRFIPDNPQISLF